AGVGAGGCGGGEEVGVVRGGARRPLAGRGGHEPAACDTRHASVERGALRGGLRCAGAAHRRLPGLRCLAHAAELRRYFNQRRGPPTLRLEASSTRPTLSSCSQAAATPPRT